VFVHRPMSVSLLMGWCFQTRQIFSYAPTSQTPTSFGFFSAMAKLWGVGGGVWWVFLGLSIL
jgi:hypothetical protein